MKNLKKIQRKVGGFLVMKNILFAASECVPFIKTGGLADVVGALPKCFDKEYFDVRVIIPKYQCMKEEFKNQLQYVACLLYTSGEIKRRCQGYRKL